MFSVLTLNLRFGLANDGPNSWPRRKKGLRPLFKKHAADFIALQEANAFQIDYVGEILREYDMIGKRSPAPSSWQNNIIFYQRTWRCLHQEHFFLSSTPRVPSRFRKSRWPRQCTMGLFAANERRLICVTTHMDFDESVQIDSARLIMDMLSHLPSDAPAVLMGDFNAAPSGLCHQVFTGNHPAINGKGPFFKNVFQEPFPGTHHGFSGKTTGDHIDWVLYRGGIVPQARSVIYDTFESIYPSDHFPLWAKFKWEEAE